MKSDNLRLKYLNCKECCEMGRRFNQTHAICCYDGVYLVDGEEEKIKNFVESNRQYFNRLDEEYIVDGNWNDIVKGRKIAAKRYIHEHPMFPKHFDNTICVMNDEDGKCLLQKVAEKIGVNYMDIKPQSCVIFPLRTKDGRICPPPSENDVDPYYVDENYPSFYKALPCCKEDKKGISFTELYKHEIEYAIKKGFIKDFK